MIFWSALAFASLNLSQSQHKTNYERIIEHPDMTNGYVEYVRASDMAHQQGLGLCLEWTPRQYEQYLVAKQKSDADPNELPEWKATLNANAALAKQLNSLGYLGVQEYAIDHYGALLDVVRAGNRKLVFEPRSRMNAGTVFPEFSDFRKIAKLFRSAAYVQFSKGDTKEGTAELLEGLTFSRKMAVGTLIAQLVSIATESTIMTTFEEHLSQLSDRDAIQIAKYAESVLDEPSPIIDCVKNERAFGLSIFDSVFASPPDFSSLSDSDFSGANGLESFIRGMSIRERQTVHDGVVKALGAFYDDLTEKLSKEESTWIDIGPGQMPASPAAVLTTDDAVQALVSFITPTFSKVIESVLRSRAQIRLLDLHARIIDYRWRFGRLPDELKETVPEKLRFDPLSKSPFVYELNDGGYRLYSKGAGSTGPIELNYRRPPDPQTGDGDPIPPTPGFEGGSP